MPKMYHATLYRMRYLYVFLYLISFTLSCSPCFNEQMNLQCKQSNTTQSSHTLHMSVHPHLDAYWIFNFESYYNPNKPTEGDVRSYFMQNNFNSVKQIFTAAKDVLWESKMIRENQSNSTQKAHRMFFNSEMGFFKKWFYEQKQTQKTKVRQILKTKYWQILGGGMVQHDQGCAYYDDIIQNYQLGLRFLHQQFAYRPRIAISSDSFGHSQTTLAILAHIGVEGYFVERSDQHLLLQNKTEFIWKAKSANGKFYGALPTHIRWAIHGYQDQFYGNNINQPFCQTKQVQMSKLRMQNQFLKRILKSTHIMRYFGHDFQKFDNYAYAVIESMMQKFSREKCNKVVAEYGNPTQYFIILMDQVFGGNIKPTATRQQDIFPIWDYDSGLYWTGYFTTDAYHKKSYRDVGRFLHSIRKIWLPTYISQPKSLRNVQGYRIMQELAEQVSYLQHHDGISGTSKYMVMDHLETRNQEVVGAVKKTVLADIFQNQFPASSTNPLFECHLGVQCLIPSLTQGDIYLKILNTDCTLQTQPLIVTLPFGEYYIPDCQHEINCFCQQDICPCKIYLYLTFTTYSSVRLQRINSFNGRAVNKLRLFQPQQNDEEYAYNSTHFKIKLSGKTYGIGYKKVLSQSTQRQYSHLSRYGTLTPRTFTIRPGKYALGNNPNQITDFSSIDAVYTMSSIRYKFFLVKWKRTHMKTIISVAKGKKNQWKVETLAAAEAYQLEDLYFQVQSQIINKNKFITDSNGWLTIPRQLFKHQDYQSFFSPQKYDDINGNTYPATSFAYIQDTQDKVSINLDRPQGVISYRTGVLWVNFDRLSSDDGKWVYQSSYRNQYQKYVHVVTVQNIDYNQRKIQRKYDQTIFVQGNLISPNEKIQNINIDIKKLNQWNQVSKINNLKFWIRPFNDSTTIVRVQNLHDKQQKVVGLYASNVSPLLTTFYGRTVTFTSVSEQALGGNIPYSEFINNKWNWNKVIDLSAQNLIFNKIFKQNITLTPLEIRTFLFVNLQFSDKCIQTKDLKYLNQQTHFILNKAKVGPTRDSLSVALERDIIKYMLDEEHCHSESPILAKRTVQSGHANATNIKKPSINYAQLQQQLQQQQMQQQMHQQPQQPQPQQQQPQQQQPQQPQNPFNQQNNNPFLPFQPPLNVINDYLIKSPQDITTTFKQIQQKIETLQKLTSLQKLIYFRKKAQLIRRTITATAAQQ